ncbi:unnamed protein product [Arctogadus glacialis]
MLRPPTNTTLRAGPLSTTLEATLSSALYQPHPQGGASLHHPRGHAKLLLPTNPTLRAPGCQPPRVGTPVARTRTLGGPVPPPARGRNAPHEAPPDMEPAEWSLGELAPRLLITAEHGVRGGARLQEPRLCVCDVTSLSITGVGARGPTEQQTARSSLRLFRRDATLNGLFYVSVDLSRGLARCWWRSQQALWCVVFEACVAAES